MSSEATTQSLSVYDVLAWLETNKKPLIVGFIIAVVLGFAIATYRYTSDRKELAASEALLKVKPTPAPDGTVTQPDPSAYLKVAEQYPNTSAGERALLLAGSTLFAQGKYQEAQAQLARFLQASPQTPFAATAAFGIAAALEAQNKTDEALSQYQNLAVRYPNSSVLDDAKLAVARIYEGKNQPELALRTYDELVKPEGMGTATAEAMARKTALLAKHPELAKTNAVTSTNVTGTVTAQTMVVSSNAPAAVGTNAEAPQP